MIRVGCFFRVFTIFHYLQTLPLPTKPICMEDAVNGLSGENLTNKPRANFPCRGRIARAIFKSVFIFFVFYFAKRFRRVFRANESE